MAPLRLFSLSCALDSWTYGSEDIDQAFRVISEALNNAGFVGTLDDYKEVIANAWKGQRQHVEFIDAVHDYTGFVQPHVWDIRNVKDESQGVVIGIKTARYFKIRKRESDGAVALWYKPDPLHQIEYPSKKDGMQQPLVTVLPTGEKVHLPNLSCPCCAFTHSTHNVLPFGSYCMAGLRERFEWHRSLQYCGRACR